MSETGQSWLLEFQAHPAEASRVREWVRSHLEHPDAPQVANELFVSVLASGTQMVEMKLSTAGSRIQLTAAGSQELSALHSHGPGFLIIKGLSTQTGVITSGLGLWALLTVKDET